MSLKVIITHWGALERKYGRKGIRAIEASIERLRVADRARHLTTRVVKIDDATSMSEFRGRSVRSVRNAEAAKAAVDAVARASRPNYILILGGPDVVPHQPISGGIDRLEPLVESDLPYACDAPFSTDARRFKAPTRRVGRLPGVTGDSDPAVLLAALATAATWQPRSRQEYARALGISAIGMKSSTSSSLKNVFGHDRDLQVVPKASWEWPERLIARRSHFLNCHGQAEDPDFQGQSTQRLPLAHAASYVSEKVIEGTVASVEACYGAQLYDPPRGSRSLPMVNAYLSRGAYAYFGGTTTTYGPSEGNAGADLICQDFMSYVLDGYSIGRAALAARRKYLESIPSPGPVDFLTLAEFCLFGDPSIHPVKRKGAQRIDRVYAKLEVEREGRRKEDDESGQRLQSTCAPVSHARALRPPDNLLNRMLSGIDPTLRSRAKVKSFTLHPPPLSRGPRSPRKLAPRSSKDDVHVVKAPVGKDARGRPRHVLVVARREKPLGAKRAKLVIRVLYPKAGG